MRWRAFPFSSSSSLFLDESKVGGVTQKEENGGSLDSALIHSAIQP